MSLAADFAAILNNPTIYVPKSGITKPGYSITASVQCDRCGQNGLETLVSSAATPRVDLCITCFNALQQSKAPAASASTMFAPNVTVGPPFNYQTTPLVPFAYPGAGTKSASAVREFEQAQRLNQFSFGETKLEESDTNQL